MTSEVPESEPESPGKKVGGEGSTFADGAQAVAIAESVIDDGLKKVLLNKERQAQLVKLVCEELEITGWTKLAVRLGVRLLAMLVAHTANAVANTFVKGIKDRLGKLLMQVPVFHRVLGYLKSLNGKVEAELEAKRDVIALQSDLIDESDLDLTKFPEALRQDVVVLESLKTLASGQDAILSKLDDLANPQPVFRSHLVERREENRFYFGSRFVPYVKREDAEAALDALLASEDLFGWTVVHGEGGSGKSRLALEYALSRGGAWAAGFLDRKADQPNWSRWQPATPHILIIDYPAIAPESVGDMLLALAGRARNGAFDAPVRVILLERDPHGDWRNKLYSREGAQYQITPFATPDIGLEPLDDKGLWKIYETFFAVSETPLPDPKETLAALAAIDEDKRALFAAFHADALKRDEAFQQWDQENLVRDVLAQEERRYWWRAGSESAAERKKWRRLAALITFMGGASEEDCMALCAALPSRLPKDFDCDEADEILCPILGPKEGEFYRGLEPDILGELFILETFGPGAATALNDSELIAAFDTAFERHGKPMMEVADRLVRDYRTHVGFAANAVFGELNQASTYFWMSILARRRVLCFRAFVVEMIQPRTLLAKATVGRGVVNFLSIPESYEVEREARYLFDWFRDLVKSTGPILRELLAFATCNRIISLKDINLDSAGDLYEELRVLALEDGGATSREAQAKAAANLIAALGGEYPDSARGLYEELKVLASEHDEPALRQDQASAAVNLIADLAQNGLDGARDLYVELKTLASDYDEPSLRELQAQAAVNLIIIIGKGDLGTARGFYKELKALASEHDEAALYEQQARAAFNLIVFIGKSDLDSTRVVVGDLIGLVKSTSTDLTRKALSRGLNAVGSRLHAKGRTDEITLLAYEVIEALGKADAMPILEAAGFQRQPPNPPDDTPTD